MTGTLEQLAAGTIFCAIYLLITMQAGPYKRTADNFLANACSFLLLVFFIVCILYKLATLTELEDVVRHLPKKAEIACLVLRRWAFCCILLAH